MMNLEERTNINNQARQLVRSLKKYHTSSYFAQLIGITPKTFNNWMCGNKRFLSYKRIEELLKITRKLQQEIEDNENKDISRDNR